MPSLKLFTITNLSTLSNKVFVYTVRKCNFKILINRNLVLSQKQKLKAVKKRKREKSRYRSRYIVYTKFIVHECLQYGLLVLEPLYQSNVDCKMSN